MEEIYQSKNQGYRRIKQASDENNTKIGRPTFIDIDYNTVAPFYSQWYEDKLFVNYL